MTSKEETVTIGGKEFWFVKPTIATVIGILKHKYEEQFQAVDFAKLAEGGEDYEKFKALWQSFCSSLFRQSLVWKILRRFGYIPKPLRFDSISLPEVMEVIQSFFVWQEAGLTRQKEPDKPSGVSV